MDGERDVLGLWLGPTGGEGAKQWMSMLSELKNRGIADALIVCCDGLKGLPDAIRVTWPDATVQTCVVHLVRNSLRYASKRHWAQITRALKEIYTAPTVKAAETRFAEFSKAWKPLYPAMIDSWERAWEDFTPFLEYPLELRKIVYTTNAIESGVPPVRWTRVTSTTEPPGDINDGNLLERRNDAYHARTQGDIVGGCVCRWRTRKARPARADKRHQAAPGRSARERLPPPAQGLVVGRARPYKIAAHVTHQVCASVTLTIPSLPGGLHEVRIYCKR
jgi:hypothetical protein